MAWCKSPPTLQIGKFTTALIVRRYGIVTNVSSPVSQQLTGFDDWSSQEISTVYRHTYFPGFGCPSVIFFCLRRITCLRIAVAAASPWQNHLSDASSILSDLLGFVPELWTEVYPLPSEPKRAILARDFQAATILYFLLSLPDNLTRRAFLSLCQNAGSKPDLSSLRRYYRSVILADLQGARGSFKQPSSLAWPASVLGIASYDSPLRDRTLVLEYLQTCAVEQDADCGAATMLDMLPDFWESGKTTWEDFYYKPLQMIT